MNIKCYRDHFVDLNNAGDENDDDDDAGRGKGRAWDGHVVSVRSISRKPSDGGQMLFSAELT